MNRSWVSKFAGLVLVLTLITTSLVAGTYAKYVTTVSGSDNVIVAKWRAVINGTAATTTTAAIDFDIFTTSDETGVNGVLLAPGTSGSFTLAYDMTGTQVAHNLLITMDVDNDFASIDNFDFFKDSAHTAVLTPSGGAIELLDADFAPDSPTNSAITVYWAWPFETAGGDTADTVDGITPVTGDVTLNFTATQRDTI
ncbi:MAG: hypothetical protein PHH65_05360 [Eubacteriales bacterium]|nr:hypothetical protein [Eubacteriales bacterium]